MKLFYCCFSLPREFDGLKGENGWMGVKMLIKKSSKTRQKDRDWMGRLEYMEIE